MQDAAKGIKNRKRIIRNSGIVFLAAVLFFTFFSKTINNFLLPEVEFTTPSQGSLEWTVNATGQVRILETEKINSLGNWKIKSVLAEEGKEVSRGTVLALIDKGDNGLDVKSLEVEISRMRNELEDYKSSFNWIDIAQYEQEACDAKKLADLLKDELATVKALYESGAEAYKTLQDEERKLEDANTDYLRKLGIVDEKKLENKKLKADYDRDVKQKSMEIDLKVLECEKLKREMSQGGEIKAPVDGVIRKVNVEKGSVCTPGQVVFELYVKGSKLAVQWKLNSEKAKLLNQWDKVNLKLKGEGSESFSGEVTKKEYLTEEDMYLYTSDISPDSSDSGLKDGQSVEVGAEKRSKVYLKTVPNSCITDYGGRHYIYLLKERSGTLGIERYVEQREIELVDQDDFNSAIEGNIGADGEKVITNTSKVLSDGMQVRLKE